MAKLYICLLALICPSLCSIAVQVFQDVTVSRFSCLRSNGFTCALLWGTSEYGFVLSYLKYNIVNARSAGMPLVEIGLAPCISCGNPARQATALVDATVGLSYDMIWVLVERWETSRDKTVNQEFLMTMVNTLISLGQNVGIYTTDSWWDYNVGNDFTECSSYPLRYRHIDGIPSFGDFVPFGGWTTPTMKEYSNSGYICQLSTAEDFY